MCTGELNTIYEHKLLLRRSAVSIIQDTQLPEHCEQKYCEAEMSFLFSPISSHFAHYDDFSAQSLCILTVIFGTVFMWIDGSA